MGNLELKKQIIQELDGADESLLHEIYAILQHQDLNWENLPQHVKKSLVTGIEQADTGQTIHHHEVMAKYKTWLQK